MTTLPKLTLYAFLTLYFLLMCWLFLPYEAVEMQTPIKVLTPVVQAGDYVALEMRFDKRSQCVPEIRWFLVDGFVLELAESGVRRLIGEQTVIREVFIPPNAPKETVHLRIEYKCQINPLRSQEYSWDTETFEII